jgi:predicted lipoprotein with Yx(FWY)xxD motif
MKRMIVLAGVLALTIAGIASAAGGGTRINLRKTNLGKLLVNAKGRTLYTFAKDKRNKDVCVKIRFCTSTWPLVTTKAKPIAGPGIQQSKLGTIKLSHGKLQVTYFGHPLYTYTGDFGPGQTSYVGVSMFGGRWFGETATGKTIK